MKTLPLFLLLLASPALAERIIHVPADMPTLAYALEAAEATQDLVHIIMAPGTYVEKEGLILYQQEYGVKIIAHGATIDFEGRPGFAVYESWLWMEGLTFANATTALLIFDDSHVSVWPDPINFVNCDAGPERGIILARDSRVFMAVHFDEVDHPMDTVCIEEERCTGAIYFHNTPGPYCRLILDGLDLGEPVPVRESSWGAIKAQYR